MHVLSDILIDFGTSILGFFASSEMVVMKSKPKYPKNNIVAP